MQITPLISHVAAVVVLTCLAGCTEERAVALKTAAEAFGSKANAAIDAVVQLSVRAQIGQPETEEKLLKGASKSLYETQKNKPGEFVTVVRESAFVWLTERDTATRSAATPYSDLKLAYAEYAAAFNRLPEGSALAAKDVTCSAALGARLTSYMAKAAEALAVNPISLVSETAASELELQSNAIASVKSGDIKGLESATSAHVAIKKEQARANAEVVAKMVDATDAGLEVLDLVDKYNDISATDIIKGLRRVLIAREANSALSSQDELKRLANLKSRLESKSALAEALSTPIATKLTQCR